MISLPQIPLSKALAVAGVLFGLGVGLGASIRRPPEVQIREVEKVVEVEKIVFKEKETKTKTNSTTTVTKPDGTTIVKETETVKDSTATESSTTTVKAEETVKEKVIAKSPDYAVEAYASVPLLDPIQEPEIHVRGEAKLGLGVSAFLDVPVETPSATSVGLSLRLEF